MGLETLEARLKQEIYAGLVEARNKEVTPEVIRETLASRRQERIIERYPKLAEIEQSFMEVMDVDINWFNIKPKLVWVESSRERKLWDYARNVVSSMPENHVVGRRMNCYFIDENSGRWLGIVCLVSALNMISPRHKHLKWEKEYHFENLSKILNIAVCIPIQPFGVLCGGKLLFVSSLSNEVRQKYKDDYGDELLAIETTSLYGRSSQYNRVKEFKYLGVTKGSGNIHIPDILWQKIKQYLYLKPEYANVGEHSQKLRSIDHVARAVGLPSEQSTHGHQRGYYWGVTAENSEDILRGEDDSEPRYYDRPLQELTDFWYERWYKMRLAKKEEEVQAFDPSVYLLDNNIPVEYRRTRQMSFI